MPTQAPTDDRLVSTTIFPTKSLENTEIVHVAISRLDASIIILGVSIVCVCCLIPLLIGIVMCLFKKYWKSKIVQRQMVSPLSGVSPVPKNGFNIENVQNVFAFKSGVYGLANKDSLKMKPMLESNHTASASASVSASDGTANLNEIEMPKVLETVEENVCDTKDVPCNGMYKNKEVNHGNVQ